MFRWLQQHGWLHLVLPLIVFAIVISAVTWPLITQLSTRVISGDISITDDIEHLRMIWWVRYALQQDLNPFYQSLFGYPNGFFSTIQWAQPLVYWPPGLLGLFINPFAAFNLWTLIVLVLNGLTAYWLCLEVIRQDAPPSLSAVAASLLGGTIFAIFPALQGHLLWGQLNIVSNYGLPIAALCLYHILKGRGTDRIAVIGALAIWVLLLSNYTSLVFLVLPLVLFGSGYWLLFHRHELWVIKWKVLRQLIVLFSGGALFSLPFYLPMIKEALDPAQAAYLQTQGAGWVLFSTDPLSFLALSPFTPWTKAIAPSYSYTILNTNMAEGSAYLGVVASVLALIGFVRQRKVAGIWLSIMLGSMLFSLGPLLKWKEQEAVYTLGLETSNIVLPWALFQKLPLLNIIRTPGRFNIMSGLALGVLAAFGLQFVLARVKWPAARLALTSILIVVTMGEYQLRFPFPTYSVTEPSYFSQLANRSDIRAVFDVPYLNTHKEALLEQMVHHKPIIAGYYARLTPVDPAKLALLSDVASGQAWQADSNPVGFPGDPLTADDARSVLKENGIDVIVYHWAQLDKTSTMNWAMHSFGRPAYADNQIAVFEVPPPVRASKRLVMTHDAQYFWPYTPPSYGLWPMGDDVSSAAASLTTNMLWLKGGARIVVYTPDPTLQQFTLNLTPLFQNHTLALTVDGLPFQTWNVTLPSDQLQFWIGLQSGFHTLNFDVSDGCTPVPVAPTCLLNGQNNLNGNPACILPASDRNLCISMEVNALQTSRSLLRYHDAMIHLDDGLTLSGFRAPRETQAGDTIPIQTDWSATQRLPGDYHLFIHVLNANGRLIAQYDGIPADGAYPTTKWAVTQQWTETVTLSIPPNMPTGSYEIYAGWYRYPDLTRLGVNSNGKHAADGLVYLRSITINQATF